MSKFFNEISPIAYEGPNTENPLAFRYYNPSEVILGKTMEEHLRFAVCYWHTFCWQGVDIFGDPTMERPWGQSCQDIDSAMTLAHQKADTAFDMYELLGVPFFTFHDRDIAPDLGDFNQFIENVQVMTDYFAEKMAASTVKPLWGTANLFSHRRYMSGAASNPDPLIFALAATQVKHALEATHKLQGENYVLWGGREGYETLLNTDMKKELDQLGRFMNLVVEHKHKIGFKGTILIEPKPQEPTKHQYDFDTATVYGFLKKYGLENEIKVNIEVGHAVLAGHSFEHEIETAHTLGIFGSIDANRNDYQSGWDTDQFPNNVPEMQLALYYILKGGGFTTGGLNFDSKLRRQSTTPEDLLYGHIGGMDTCARALIAAANMIEQGELNAIVAQRYAGWDNPQAQKIMDGNLSLDDIANWVKSEKIMPEPVSGRQEYIENLVNKYLQ